MSDNVDTIDDISESDELAPPTPTPPRRGPGHRGQDVRDTMAEMAAKAHEISLEAGSKMAGTMREVIGAAAGLTAFAIESARDLVQYMVRRGQMTQDEADKLMREVEAAHASLPKVPLKAEPPKAEATKKAQSPTAAPVSVSPSAQVATVGSPVEHHPTAPVVPKASAIHKMAETRKVVVEEPKLKHAAPTAVLPAATKASASAKHAGSPAAKSAAKPVAAPLAKSAVQPHAKPTAKGGTKAPMSASAKTPSKAPAKVVAKSPPKNAPKAPPKGVAKKAAAPKKK